MVSDYRYHLFDGLRNYLSLIVYPIQWTASLPTRLSTAFSQYAHTYNQLLQENKSLKQAKFLQQAQLQKLMSLEAENTRLRALLKTLPRAGENWLAAEIIRIHSDPFSRRVILNKGANHGVTLGQPVIDATGVIGEVIEVHPFTSRVILISDASYGISVENLRNGIRGIAAGRGVMKNLELQHVANTLDLEVGDTLMTSGLDGRYPPGYPVGIVSDIKYEQGESFARISITPSAHLERSRQVLLVQRTAMPVKE